MELENSGKMLLCNVSWMQRYDGLGNDKPLHGGQYVRENGFGHEAINFRNLNDKVYGFVQLRTGSINISRLDSSAGDSTDGVLIVWRARSIEHGSVIVGWYKNAIVFRTVQKAPPGRSFTHDGKTIPPEWVFRANASDAFLIPPEKRSFRVPVSHKGFGSQTFVSFLDSGLGEVVAYRDSLLRYIREVESGRYPQRKRGKRPQVDQVRKILIEEAAVEAAINHYSQLGYEITDVQKDNVGYDLKARYEREVLFIEVKGTARDVGKGVTVNLTPNEYRKSRQAKRRYRICIVTSALHNPTLHNFAWDHMEKAWVDEKRGKMLQIAEVVSADMTIL